MLRFALLLFALSAWTGSLLAQPAQPRAETEKPAEEPPEETLTSLPKKDDLPIPSLEECLKGKDYDWLILVADHVLVVEPVHPRPGTIEFMNQKIKQALPRNPTKETAEERQKRQALNYLTVTLPAEKEQDYKLGLEYIRDILYFEDLMLRRVDLLLDEQKTREALQVLLAVERRQRNWPGTADRQKRLLFVEAAVRAKAGEAEAGLGYLEDLLVRDKEYPELAKRAGEVAEPLISAAVSAHDYRQARLFLRRLRAFDADHAVARKWSEDLLDRARDEVAQATAAERQGQADAAASHIEQAARYWPETPDLQTVHRRLVARYQRLRVGVLELPRASGPVREAERRQQALTELPLFRPQRVGRRMVRFDGPLLQGWEPTDLGHSLQLELRTHLEPWESRPSVTARDVALSLADRLDPRHPAYDERIATFVDSVSVDSPTRLTVNFHIVPLRPEALFTFPVSVNRSPPQTAEPAARAGGAGTGSGPQTWPFQVVTRGDTEVVWRRTVAERETPNRTERHVSEIIERRYASPETAIQGLLRGEVDVLPRVPAWTVAALESKKDFYLLRYDQPETHILHFRPESRAVSSRELRRALVYCLNRPQILGEAFLRGAPEAFGRPASGPMPSYSYASNPAVGPHKFDPALALSLVPAIKKEMGGKLPSLTLAAPPEPSVQEAVKRIVEAWKRLGVAVAVVAEDAPEWDVCYRVLQLTEPAVELWPALTYPHGSDVASLRPIAPWLRDQLLVLDQVGDFGRAEANLHRIHAQLWAEAQLIPLWELQPVMAARKNLRGISDRPFVTYDGIEHWHVEPWYTKE